MLIGVRKRFIFVANTKTASTSIEHTLANHAEIMRGGSGRWRKHLPLRAVPTEYAFVFRPKRPFESYFRFGVMRDPIAWIDSWYRYRISKPNIGRPLPPGMSFADYWHSDDAQIRQPDGSPTLQADMFRDADGTLLADVIIPFERMDQWLPPIFAALGADPAIERRNVSPMRPGESGLPPSLIDEIRTHYTADYALYDQLDAINAAGMDKLRALAPAGPAGGKQRRARRAGRQSQAPKTS